MNYQSNPPWVNRLLTSNWDALRDRVDPAWMPQEAPSSSGRGRALQEYGCGHYGCVLPTAAEKVVLKVTSDPLEALFVAQSLKIGHMPDGLVRYHAIWKLDGNYRGRPTYAIWREEAYEVGVLGAIIAGRRPDWYLKLDAHDRRTILEFSDQLIAFKEWASDFKTVFDRATDKPAIWRKLKEREDWAFQRVELQYIEEAVRHRSYALPTHLKGIDRLAFALRACELVAEVMSSERGGYLVGQTLSFYLEHGLLLADVHSNNVGRVKREDYSTMEFAITDPGHAVPLRPEMDAADVASVAA